ncbi:hypothetical protein [Salinivibrio sp. ML290]|uniref:hypothetical protein n=1 Tax=Salinivibrio sp. ML290 TaxID=1909468 RepID=UPI000988648A|nr:hypothetical protein [Salinivibrio sp. ML290]OOE76337.1 hypothetical protein BZG23_02505 [Salinivibrio sp. ML290]
MKNILLVILGSLIAVGAFWGWNEYQAKQAELERTQLRNELFTQIDDVIERNDEYFSYLNKQIQLLVRPCDGIRNYERYKACAEGAQSEAHARANNRFGFTRNDLSREIVKIIRELKSTGMTSTEIKRRLGSRDGELPWGGNAELVK